MRNLLLLLLIGVIIACAYAHEPRDAAEETASLTRYGKEVYGSPLALYRVKRGRGGKGGRKSSKGGKEHTKNQRKSTQEKHQKGRSRKGSDSRGGEKGDSRRSY